MSAGRAKLETDRERQTFIGLSDVPSGTFHGPAWVWITKSNLTVELILTSIDPSFSSPAPEQGSLILHLDRKDIERAYLAL